MSKSLTVFLLAVVLSLSVTGPVAAAEDIELNWFFCCSQQERSDMFNGWAREYESLNPGIKINAHFPGGAYYDAVATTILGGAGPDVVWLGGGFHRFVEGFLMPLDDFVAKDPDLSSIYAPIMQANVWKGQQLGIPFGINTNSIYYNTNLTQSAGVNIPSKWTWNELIDVGRRLTKDTDGDGNPDNWGFSLYKANYRGFLYSYAGSPYSADGKTMNINDSWNAEILQTIQDIWSQGTVVPPLNGPSYEGRNEFKAGKLGMIMDGVFNIQVLTNVEGVEIDIAPNPSLVHNGETRRVDPMTLESWAVSNQTKHPQEALAFLKFIANREHMAQFAEMGGVVPSIPSAMQSFLAADFPKHRSYFVESLNYVGSDVNRHPAWSMMSKDFKSVETQVFKGELAPEVALVQLEELGNAKLAEFWAAK